MHPTRSDRLAALPPDRTCKTAAPALRSRMHSSGTFACVLASGIIACLSHPIGAAAQTAADTTSTPPGSGEPASGGLAEVIVTAQRRAQRLQDVPISVSAFSQDKLDTQGLRNIDDLTQLSPGVSFQRMGLSDTSNYNDENSDLAFRGVDSNAGTSTSAVYVDDTPIQGRHIGFGTVNAFPVLFDLQRVEVLRGPQGTLFGASAEGGAVRFVTPQPSLSTYTSYARTELSNTDHGGASYEIGAAGGGPLIDGVLGFRASASFREDGGYVDRMDYRTGVVTQPNANYERTAALKLGFKWAINDKLSVTPSIYYQRLYLNDTSAFWPQLSDPSGERFDNGNAQRNPSTDPWYLAAVRLDWDLGSAQMTTNVSYFSRRQYDTPDYTQFDRANYGLSPFAPYGVFGESPFKDNQDNTTAEIKLLSTDAAARLTWTAGLYFAHLNENEEQNIIDPALNAEYLQATGSPICTAAAPCPGGQIFTQPLFRIIDRQVALFGEANLELWRGWSLTAGVRVEHATYTGASDQYGPFLGPQFGAQTPLAAAGSTSANPVTPRLVLSYRPTAATMLYASAAKGYREGGINGGLGSTCVAQEQAIGLAGSPIDYRPDSLWSYELGAKLTLLQDRLQIDTSFFYIDWQQIQQNVYLTSCGQQFVANLGAAKSQGGDIDVQYRPIEDLTLSLQASYTDARYTATVCGGPVGCGTTVLPIVSKDDRLPGPPWTATLSGEYDLHHWAGRVPYARFDYHLTTRQLGLLPTQNPTDGASDFTIPNTPGYSTLAIRAGMRWSDFDVSLFGENLLNAHPILLVARDTTVSPLYFDRSLRPRTLGLTLTYHY
jgi:iron complex outermembrane receptor protein